MKPSQLLASLALLFCAGSMNAARAYADYHETLQPDARTMDLRRDFGLVDDGGRTNQSAIVQKAIDNLAAQGGGRLNLPKGTYQFSGVVFKSNVHLFVEKDTVIRPYWPEGRKTVIFALGAPNPRHSAESFIENVSIRGLGGRFIVDYSNRGSRPGEGVRTVNCRQVRNFLVSDILVKDSFTTYCAFIFTPAKDNEAKKQAVFRPTDGLVRNIESVNSSPGYGLVQMHAGDHIDFDNLRAVGGGVAFRLETGAGGHNGGIHDITAKNVYCENGSTAVLLGPHKAQNGVVRIDGVTAKSCAWAVTAGPGYVEQRNQDDPYYKPGRFGDGTTVRNVHAIFGENAAIGLKGIGSVPTEYLSQLRIDEHDRVVKRVRGPSIGVVKDSTGDSWDLIVENVTSEGFKHNAGVVQVEKTKRANWREILKGLPIVDHLEDQMRQRDSKTK